MTFKQVTLTALLSNGYILLYALGVTFAGAIG